MTKRILISGNLRSGRCFVCGCLGWLEIWFRFGSYSWCYTFGRFLLLSWVTKVISIGVVSAWMFSKDVILAYLVKQVLSLVDTVQYSLRAWACFAYPAYIKFMFCLPGQDSGWLDHLKICQLTHHWICVNLTHVKARIGSPNVADSKRPLVLLWYWHVDSLILSDHVLVEW